MSTVRTVMSLNAVTVAGNGAASIGQAEQLRGEERVRVILQVTGQPTLLSVAVEEIAMTGWDDPVAPNTPIGKWIGVGVNLDTAPSADPDTLIYDLPKNNYRMLRLRLDQLGGGTAPKVTGYMEFGGG